MIKIILFISSIFSVTFPGINTLPIAEDHIWSTFLDINELNVDGFDDVKVTLAEGNNPFQDDEVTLEIVKLISCEKSSVTIKRNRMLADKSTAIWYGLNTYRGYGDIRYEKSTIEEIPEEFPDFAMFQNYGEKIALVAFGNETDWIWEGFIGNSIIQHISGNLYVLLDVTFPSPISFTETMKTHNYSAVNHMAMDLKTKRMQIIPEILVALDWKSVENKTARDVIKEVIVYYNAVDMLFSQFTSPRIQLNIAGIVIPMDSRSSPYFEKKSCKIEKEYYSNECVSFSPILDILIRHFRKYIDVFPTKDYDIIMGMTSLPLCDDNDVCEYYGTSFESGTCENVDEDHYAPITGAVRHPHFRGNYFLAAREIGHILGSKYIAKWAHAYYGGIMSEIDDYQDLHQWRLNWSSCATRYISTHIRERENYTKCMWNLPDFFEEPELSSITTETAVETTTTETTVEATTTETMVEATTMTAITVHNESTTTEIISTAAPGDTTIPIISTDTSDTKTNVWSICGDAEIPPTSTETTTIDVTTAAEVDTTISTTTTDSTTPDDTTITMTPTATPDDTTITMSSKTTLDAATTVEHTTLPEENILTIIKPQTFEAIDLDDSVTVIVVKRNVDGKNVIMKRPKTLKKIVGDIFQNIYNFIGKKMRKDVNY